MIGKLLRLLRPLTRRRLQGSRRAFAELLEPRLLLSVTAEEQYFVYRLNRARNDPAAYAAEANLSVSLSGTPARPPLAVNNDLFDSAGFKSSEMASHNYWGHRSAVTGIYANKLVRNHGYDLDALLSDHGNAVESLAGGQTSVEAAMDALIVDAGVPSLGHRKHLLGIDSFNEDNREIGVGYAFSSSSTYKHYWSIHSTRSDPADTFLTGVVYHDANGNQRYDRNEGLGGVTVSNGTVDTRTNPHGGWSLKVAAGEYLVTASGGAFSGTSTFPVAVGSDSIELDFVSGLNTGYVAFDLWENTAPVLDTNVATTLLPVVRDDATPSSNLAADLLVGRVTDPDPAVLQGIAVQGLTGSGNWQYSTNGGADWISFGSVSQSRARLLAPTDQIRFVPNSGFTGTAVLSYRAWDQTTGVPGSTASVLDNGGSTAFSAAVETAVLTVIEGNTAPALNTSGHPTLTPVREDSVSVFGDSVSSLLRDAISDPDPGAASGISIVGVTGEEHGTWQYSLDQAATWSDVGPVTASSGRLVRPLDRIRFVPRPNFNGTATLAYRAWDQMTGAAGELADHSGGTGGATSFSSETETASITVSPVNDAPVLDPSHEPKLTPIPPNTTFRSNGGNTVAELIGTAVSDIDRDAVQGIAVIGKTGNGNWWFRNNGSWGGGTTSPAFAWLLKPTDRVQFTPNSGWTGTASIEFIAWDQTTGPTHSGRWADVSTSAKVGGTTAYSVAADSATVFVGNAGAAPAIVSLVRSDPSPTQASSVRFTATFSETVTGVDPSDFELTTTGDVSGRIATVSGTGATRTITVDQINGEGTLAIGFSGEMNIKDVPGNLLNTAGFSGSEVYTVAPQRLELRLSEVRIAENDGDRAAYGTIIRHNSDNRNALTVTVTGSDPGEATVPTTATIPAGQASGQFYVAAVDDNTLDGTQTLVLTASAAGFQSGQASLLVHDHETLTISVSSASLNESAGRGAATVTIERSNTDDSQPPADLRVTSSDASEATVDTTSLPFRIHAVDDDIIDGRQTVTLTASASGFVSGETTILVDDNDVAGFTVAESGGQTQVSELGTTDTFTVVLDARPQSDVVIDVSSGDVGEAIVDVTTLTFTPSNWDVARTVTVTGQDELQVDGDQVTEITLAVRDSASDAAFHTVADRHLSVTTTDDDIAGVIVAESNGDTRVSESGTTDTLTVVLAAQPVTDVVIDIQSADRGEARVDVSSLTFTSANWDTAQTVTVTGQDDPAADGDQTISVSVSINDAASDDAFHSVDDQSLSVLVTDDDLPGFTISESGDLTRVSESGTTDAFTVVLDAQPASDVVLDISGSDSGEAKVDVSSLTFTAADWNTPRTVTVTGVDDSIQDGTQTSTITVSVRDAASDNRFDPLPDQTVSVLTTDDERTTFTVTETGTGTTVTEAGATDVFAVVLDSRPLSNVVIDIASADSGEATVSVASLEFTPDNWNLDQVVTVTGVDDWLDDGDQQTVITLATVASDGHTVRRTLTATTTDDDVAGLTVVESGETVVAESGTTDTFTVVLDAQPVSRVVIDVTTADPGEATVNVSSLVFTGATWNIPQTVTVTGEDDWLDDGDQQTTVTLSVRKSSSDDTFDAALAHSVSVTTADDDEAGFAISESEGHTRVSESGTTDTFTVVLLAQPTSDVRVEISTSDAGEATADVSSLTFTAENWDIAQTVTVTGSDDNETDGHQSSELTLSVSGGLGQPLARFGNRLFELQNGNVFDANTGLEWLDLKLTDNQSFDQVTERINTGDLSGWTYASPTQLKHLLLNAGVPEATFSVHHGDNYEPAATLLSFWGEFVAPAPGGESNQYFLNSDFALDAGVARRRAGRMRFPANRQGAVSPAGPYYNAWHAEVGLSSALIRSRNDSGAYSAVPDQTVSVITVDDESPTVTAPVGRVDLTRPTLAWNAVSGADSYEVWLEQIGGTANPVANPIVSETSYTPSADLQIGRYRTWVRARFADGGTTAWGTANFQVSLPVNVDPLPFYGSDRRPVISWAPVRGATSYRIYISNWTAGGIVVADEVVSNTRFQPPASLEFGRYRIWVRAIGPGDYAAAWSAVNEYYIGPDLLTPMVSTFDTNPVFTWESLPGIDSFQLYVSTGSRVVINERGLNGNSYQSALPFEIGDYRWWLRPFHSSGRSGAWSQLGEFSIGGRPIPKGPAGTITDSIPELVWEAVEGAGSYEIYLFSDDRQELIDRRRGIQGTSYLTHPLPDGSYRFWVKSWKSDGSPGRWSRSGKFIVGAATSSATAHPVRPVTPTFQLKPTFQWSGGAGATAYDFYLTNGEDVTSVQGITAQSYTPPTPLTAGPWKWWVRAQNASGGYGAWSQPATTDVSGRPVLLLPLGSTTDRAPQISWTSVSGASRYVFQLDDLTTGRTALIRDNNVRHAQYTPDSPLVPGTYRAWVRAINGTTDAPGPWSVALEFSVI